jgi:hypothetical protein
MRHIRPLLSFLLSLSACTHESTTQKSLKTPITESALNSKFSAFVLDEASTLALVSTRLPLHAKKIFVPPALAVERRLYSDEVEASSFLWTNWNRFQENYHPNYIMDGDPKTAWVEGVSGSGAGESIKIHVSEVAKTTKLRVKIKSGYQKSKGLFTQNARPKTIELIAHPSKEKKSFTLKDAMGWQELSFEQKEGAFNTLELKVVDAYEGKKYTDLCISDVEIYATSTTKENAAFEKKKLDTLLAWKKERVTASKEWKAQKTNTLPVAPGYQINDDTFSTKFSSKSSGEMSDAIDTLSYLAIVLPEAKVYAERAKAALESKPSSWTSLSFSIVAPVTFPMVDGLQKMESNKAVEFYDFIVPTFNKSTLLLNSSFSAFDSKEKHGDTFFVFETCSGSDVKFWRNSKLTQTGPSLSEVIVEVCQLRSSEREGDYRESFTQVLEYDDKGRLVLMVTPLFVQYFTWKEDGKSAFINAGWKLRSSDQYEKLTVRK